MAKISLVLLLACVAAAYTEPAVACTKIFDVKSFGAVGNGAANDTGPIQSAIDAAHAAGCGTVLGHAGDIYLVYRRGIRHFAHVSGLYPYSLAIPSNVTLNPDHQNSSIIVNANYQNAGDQNISLKF
jgi:hypothetical protein